MSVESFAESDKNNNCQAIKSGHKITSDILHFLPSTPEYLSDNDPEGNPLKRCRARTQLNADDGEMSGDVISATHSLENMQTSRAAATACANGSASKSSGKMATGDWHPVSYARAAFPKHKALEFEDLLSSDAKGWRHNASHTPQKANTRHSVPDDLLFDNPFDACLFQERQNPVTFSENATLTPLRHVTNENVFLDVADRISRVMEEYTSKHRSQLQQQVDTAAVESERNTNVASSKTTCLDVIENLQQHSKQQEEEKSNAVSILILPVAILFLLFTFFITAGANHH